MATISNTIALTDAMTPALQNIGAALQNVTAAFEYLQSVSSNAVNTDAINGGARALENVQDEQEDLNQSIRRGESAASGLWGKIKGLIAAYAGWQVVTQTVAWSDEMTNIQSRLDMINDGTMTNKQLMDEIYLSAQRSRGSFQATADLVGKIGNNAAEAFENNSEIIAFAEQLNKQFVISGANMKNAQDAITQLVQGLAAGALRGDELNSVMEQAPEITKSLAKYLNVSVGEIRTIAAEGKITADIVKNAMFAAAEETNAKFEQMPLTFSAAWTMAKNTFQMNMMGVQKVLSETFNTAQFQAIMDGLTAAVSTFAQVAIPAIQFAVKLVGWLYEAWDFIAPVVWGVVGAMTAYKIALMGVALWEGITKGIKVAGIIVSYAKAAATGTEVMATTAATAAQWGLNTALYACPLTWIVLAIIAVIAAIYLVVAAINAVTGESISATGIIFGLVSWLWGMIKNYIAAFWNTTLAVVEFFINVWQNPVYAIKKVLYNIVEAFGKAYTGILKGLDPVITALTNGFLSWVNNSIKAINWLSSALDKIGLGWGQIGEIQVSAGWSAKAESTVNSMLAALDPGKAPDNYKSLSKYKMEFADPTEYYKKGYETGANLFNFKGLATDELTESLLGQTGLNSAALGGIGAGSGVGDLADGQKQQQKTLQEIADNTGRKADQDFKYLAEIMHGRRIDRLSGTDIRIQMNNNNSINSSMDLDKVVNQLAKKLTAAVDSAAEGVHY